MPTPSEEKAKKVRQALLKLDDMRRELDSFDFDERNEAWESESERCNAKARHLEEKLAKHEAAAQKERVDEQLAPIVEVLDDMDVDFPEDQDSDDEDSDNEE